MNTLSVVTAEPCAPDSVSDAQRKFHERVIELSRRFTAKEVARAFLVSTQFMRKYGEDKGIIFASAENRAPDLTRRLRRELARLKEEARVRQLKPIQPSPGENGLVLSPALDAASRKALVDRENQFIERLMVLSKTHTLNQAQRATHVNLRALRRIAYDHGIVFTDQVEPFNEEEANATLVEFSQNGNHMFKGLPKAARLCLVGFLTPSSLAR